MSGSGVCTPLLNRYSKCLSNLSTKIVKALVPMTLGFQVMVKPGLFHTNRKRHWHQDFGFSIALCLVNQLWSAFQFFREGGGIINCTSYLSFFSVILMHVKGSGKNSQTPISFCNDLPLIFFLAELLQLLLYLLYRVLTIPVIQRTGLRLIIWLLDHLVRLDPWSAHVAKNMGGSRANSN